MIVSQVVLLTKKHIYTNEMWFFLFVCLFFILNHLNVFRHHQGSQ